MTKDRQQKELLRKCGFKIQDENPAYRTWVRGELRIALIVGKCPSLRKLVNHVIDQTVYRVRKGTRVAFRDVFYDNEGGVIGKELS